MKANFLITNLLFAAALLLSLSSAHATGFGWYVSSFDWSDFEKQLETLKNTKSAEKQSLLADQIVMEMIGRHDDNEKRKIPFSFLSIEESPMDSMEFYWTEALEYANRELASRGKVNNFFTRFDISKSSISLPESIIAHSFDPSFFVLSPKDVGLFYKQLKALSSKGNYPDDYKSYLLHLEGVLLKTSALDERGLVFFGHD